MVHRDCPKRGSCPNRKLSFIPQGAIKFNLGQVAGGVHHAGDAVLVQVMRSIAHEAEFLFLRKQLLQRPFHHCHGRFQQNSAGMPAGIANNVSLFGGIGHRLIGNTSEGQRLRVKEERMFRREVHDHGPIGDSTVEQFMRGSGRRSRVEVRTNNQHFAIGTISGVSLDPLDKLLRLIGSNRALRRRQVESVKFQAAEPHVHMRIRNSRDHGSSLEVDDLGLRSASAPESPDPTRPRRCGSRRWQEPAPTAPWHCRCRCVRERERCRSRRARQEKILRLRHKDLPTGGEYSSSASVGRFTTSARRVSTSQSSDRVYTIRLSLLT